MSQQIRIDPAVNHERLDDEVIAINVESGVYFAMDDAAAECWTAAAAGGGVDQMAELLHHRYDVELDRARTDAHAFVASLVEQRLVRVSEEPAIAVPLPDAPVEGREPYRAPVLQGFDDLEALLLIDPIHDVDDAGWPLPVQGEDA